MKWTKAKKELFDSQQVLYMKQQRKVQASYLKKEIEEKKQKGKKKKKKKNIKEKKKE